MARAGVGTRSDLVVRDVEIPGEPAHLSRVAGRTWLRSGPDSGRSGWRAGIDHCDCRERRRDPFRGVDRAGFNRPGESRGFGPRVAQGRPSLRVECSTAQRCVRRQRRNASLPRCAGSQDRRTPALGCRGGERRALLARRLGVGTRLPGFAPGAAAVPVAARDRPRSRAGARMAPRLG